jgi:hypothetical protein
MWRHAISQHKPLHMSGEHVSEIVRMRNQIVHGRSDQFTLDQLVEAFVWLSDLTGRIRRITKGPGAPA